MRHFLQNRVGETLVDELVLQPVFGTENRTRMGDVTKRPKPFVRKAVVVAFVFLLREPDAPKRVAGAVGGNAEVVVGVNNFAVSAARAICDPSAVTRQQNGFKRGDHTARGHEHFDYFVSVKKVDVRLAIPKHEQGLILKPVAKADPQTFRSP